MQGRSVAKRYALIVTFFSTTLHSMQVKIVVKPQEQLTSQEKFTARIQQLPRGIQKLIGMQKLHHLKTVAHHIESLIPTVIPYPYLDRGVPRGIHTVIQEMKEQITNTRSVFSAARQPIRALVCTIHPNKSHKIEPRDLASADPLHDNQFGIILFSDTTYVWKLPTKALRFLCDEINELQLHHLLYLARKNVVTSNGIIDYAQDGSAIEKARHAIAAHLPQDIQHAIFTNYKLKHIRKEQRHDRQKRLDSIQANHCIKSCIAICAGSALIALAATLLILNEAKII